MHQIGPVAEGGHERNREPVALGFAKAGLTFYVVGEMRKRVALRFAAIVGDGFVAASEADRLERQEADLLRIIQRELNDATDLLVVNAVDNCHHRNNFNASSMQV